MIHSLSKVWRRKNVGSIAPDKIRASSILPTCGSIGKHGVFVDSGMLNKLLCRQSLAKTGKVEHGQRCWPIAEALANE